MRQSAAAQRSLVGHDQRHILATALIQLRSAPIRRWRSIKDEQAADALAQQIGDCLPPRVSGLVALQMSMAPYARPMRTSNSANDGCRHAKATRPKPSAPAVWLTLAMVAGDGSLCRYPTAPCRTSGLALPKPQQQRPQQALHALPVCRMRRNGKSEFAVTAASRGVNSAMCPPVCGYDGVDEYNPRVSIALTPKIGQFGGERFAACVGAAAGARSCRKDGLKFAGALHYTARQFGRVACNFGSAV